MANRRTPHSTRNPKSTAAASPKTSAAAAKTTASEPGTTTTPAPASADATPAVAAKPAPAKRVAKPKTPKAGAPAGAPQVSEETRRAMIAESAYLRAERRGFAPGGEVQDWCEAEKEVDALLNASTGAAPQ